MIDSIKKALLTGVGLAAMSKEKIEAWAKQFAEEAKLAEGEGKKFVEDILKQTEEARKNAEDQVSKFTKAALDKMGLHTKAEYDELKKRVEELERKIAGR
ncbi:MAG: phasin family protein [Spirochaetes bacterium]|nr:phasin family protein [Spirochaetota bacterium]HPA71812.1 phasin family protein [Spirochaetota bacterium]